MPGPLSGSATAVGVVPPCYLSCMHHRSCEHELNLIQSMLCLDGVVPTWHLHSCILKNAHGSSPGAKQSCSNLSGCHRPSAVCSNAVRAKQQCLQMLSSHHEVQYPQCRWIRTERTMCMEIFPCIWTACATFLVVTCMVVTT